MNYKKRIDVSSIGATLLIVIMIAVLCLPFYGYVSNIVKLCHCDFESPMKSEVIRGVGIVVPFVGAITGFMELKDEPSEKGK